MHKDEDYHKTLALKYGNGEFSEEKYQYKLSIIEKENNSKTSTQSTQPQNTPRCPTCNSTNIRKIKAGERTASIIGFGIFSRKANKTWKCENCGHLW